MHEGRIIFAQVMDWLPRYEFDKCVRRYQGNRYAKSLTCYEQFLIMAFAQLTYRESLRDIETCLRAVDPSSIMRGCAAWEPEAPWPMPTKDGIGASSPTSLMS